jgi:beta-lactam-binding protein with PASTA domain
MTVQREIPDVLAKPQEEAEAILKNAGIKITIRKTTPPRGPIDSKQYRIVRQTALAKDHVELVIAAEITGKEVQRNGV